MIKKIGEYIKKNFLFLTLVSATLVFLFVNIKINVFRYNNFDLGKFDLGNMTQMVWNASKGNGLWLTDYFGTNLPRWAMSHVDPILYIFVPIFKIFPSPLTLVISQLVLVLFSSLLVYGIAKIHLNSKLVAFLFGIAYLFNPAIGFLTAWTAFHGVTAVIFFFLAAFYIFEKAYYGKGFTRASFVAFWVMLILTMMGKEQLPAYISFYGLFIILLRNGDPKNLKDIYNGPNTKIALSMMIIGVLWFVTAFFIIIPRNAHYRIEGYQAFAESMGLSDAGVRDVELSNYFLNRYDQFGDSYGEVILNMIINPKLSIQVFFSGDKVENFNNTFAPLGYLPFAYPLALLMASVDFAINYLTTAGGIGTSEIMNHRVSMIIPVLFISSILGISYLSSYFKKKKQLYITLLASILLLSTFYTTHTYNNPTYLWMKQALYKKVVSKVFAKSDVAIATEPLEIGDLVKLSALEEKDRECAAKIVRSIPDGVSVSGPDSLGAHLSMRETYAIFPALYNSADYVIVDVFARKILTILDTDVTIVKDVVETLIKDSSYELKLGCGNYFVFKNVGDNFSETLLPIQERFSYDGKYEYDLYSGISVVDFSLPSRMSRGSKGSLNVVYFRGDEESDKNTSLDQAVIFTTFLHTTSGEIYQHANLPSFALTEVSSWGKNRYYTERIDFVMPDFIEAGQYRVFVGIGNKIRTRSIYLGDMIVD